MRQCACTAVPGDEDAQQINVVGSCQQHNHTQSQFEHKEPADNLVNAVPLAQCQEVQVVQVRGNVRDACMETETELHLKTKSHQQEEGGLFSYI